MVFHFEWAALKFFIIFIITFNWKVDCEHIRLYLHLIESNQCVSNFFFDVGRSQVLYHLCASSANRFNSQIKSIAEFAGNSWRRLNSFPYSEQIICEQKHLKCQYALSFRRN